MKLVNNLISSTNLVQVPQVIVKIGNYEFGSYSKIGNHTEYPNYVQQLQVTKINGRVNTYTLTLNYVITEFNDPNYFEKVFSSVNKSRKITFTYGDCAQKDFMYRNEEALITEVTSSFQPDSAQITYVVKAVSAAALAGTGGYQFPATFDKPSNVLYKLLMNNVKYGLQDLFPGMRDIALCKEHHLIADNDIAVQLEAKVNMSILDYMQYLVSNMTSSEPSKRIDGTKSQLSKRTFYVLKYMDDTSGMFPGAYFEVVEVNSAIEHPEAYQLDYGFPGSNLARNLQINNNENFSIYYDYQNDLHPTEYVRRINNAGEYEEVYAPILSSKNDQFVTHEEDRSWWNAMTQYPLKASITIKGLLRPAILMSYLQLNIIFFGAKHVDSGLYIITKQEDTIDGNGFSTRLDLVRIAGTEEGIV